MNTDDIFTFSIREDAIDAHLVTCTLAWDQTAIIRVSCPGPPSLIPYAKREAIGWMWEQHGDEIIKHIQDAIEHEEIDFSIQPDIAHTFTATVARKPEPEVELHFD